MSRIDALSRIDKPRREFLKAAGICIALPVMESLGAASRARNPQPVRRMVCIGNEFGMYPGSLWPKTSGRDYESTELLKPLAGQRKHLALFSHLDHGLKGGHFAVHTFLTGVKSSDTRGMAAGAACLHRTPSTLLANSTARGWRLTSWTPWRDKG